MLVHGQLKHALRAFLSIERGWVVVQVHHTDHHGGDAVVQELALWTHFWGLIIGGLELITYCIWTFDEHVTTTHPDFNVEYFSFQEDWKSLEGDKTTRPIDVKNAIITWNMQQQPAEQRPPQ